MNKWYDDSAVVTDRREGPGWFRLDLQLPTIARAAVPGQFVMVKIPGSDPFLRRPLSVHDADQETDTLSLLVAPVGRGTKLLSEVRPGEQLRVSGPYGNGFGTPPPDQRLVLIGGGIGAAPLLFIARCWHETVSITTVIGARSQEDLPPLADFQELTQLIVATDDGSVGIKGTAVAATADNIDSNCVIWACGPLPMLRAARELASEHGIECLVSVETTFACGIGVCAGCAVPRADGQGYWRACHDGPVFPAGEVLL